MMQEQQESDLEQQSIHDQDEDSSKKARFKEGQELTFVRVRFPGNAKSHPFFVGKRRFQYGQKVLAMSDRGMTVGYINSFPYNIKFEESMLPVRSISKVASDEDIQQQLDNINREKEAEQKCLELIEKYNLDMTLTHVEFIQFGKKAVFYFNAPARVDFRELVKDLVGELKMRIELRQISVRDRTAALGAVGACGLQTCCSSFLSHYGNVSIKMAKNQNLALVASKINGVCGQLKCCIRYEDEVYSSKRKNLPPEGEVIRLSTGELGKVLRTHILLEQFDVLTSKGIKKRFVADYYDKHKSLNEEERKKFPTEFRNITDETSTVIGLKQGQDYFEDEHQTIDEEVSTDLHAPRNERENRPAKKEREAPQETGRRENNKDSNHRNSSKRSNKRRSGNRRRNKGHQKSRPSEAQPNPAPSKNRS